MTRAATLLAVVSTLAAPGPAAALPSPARWGDFSLGAGPALLLRDGDAAPGLAAEANLLAGAFSIGLRGRVAAAGGEVLPAAGLEASVLGLLGGGIGVQQGGASIDGLLQVPLPALPSPWFLTVSWRPSFLLAGGVHHEVALCLKFSSLLVPERD